MADCYGNLVFTRSQDCEFDAECLVRCANDYEWGHTFSRWKTCNYDGDVYLAMGGTLEFPSGIPLIGLTYYIDCPLRGDLELNRSEMEESDWPLVYAVDTDEAPLQEFAARISSCIIKGWVEFSAVGNEASRFIYFESVRVFASGKAVLCQRFAGPVVDKDGRDEVYDPGIEPTLTNV